MNEEIKTKNEVVENTDEEKASFNPKDYSVIRDMMKEMDDWNKMLKDETHSILKNSYGLTNFAVLGIIPYTDEKIEAMTLEEINAFMEKYKDHSVKHIDPITTVEDGVKVMKEVKELQMNLYSAEEEASKLKEQSQDILNDYFEYLSSPEVVEARKKRLDKMRELVEVETDEYKKYQMKKMIDSIEKSDNMEFIFKRFYDNAEREAKLVMEQFFDEKRGSYVIDRYKKKITKFGFDVNLYKYFFNLEENFLDEKYHVFNNLFLFHYMRFIAYADPYDKTDKLFVQAMTSAIANMVYHKFNSKMEEQKFVHVIEKFEEYFIDKYDYFMENNTTRPGHPVREQASAKYETDQKARLIAKMDELGITGYTKTMTAKEMQEFFNSEMDKLLDAQKKEKAAKSIVTENKDGSVEIKPDMSEEKTVLEEDNVTLTTSSNESENI
jgi:hypothetical protein